MGVSAHTVVETDLEYPFLRNPDVLRSVPKRNGFQRGLPCPHTSATARRIETDLLGAVRTPLHAFPEAACVPPAAQPQGRRDWTSELSVIPRHLLPSLSCQPGPAGPFLPAIHAKAAASVTLGIGPLLPSHEWARCPPGCRASPPCLDSRQPAMPSACAMRAAPRRDAIPGLRGFGLTQHGGAALSRPHPSLLRPCAEAPSIDTDFTRKHGIRPDFSGFPEGRFKHPLNTDFARRCADAASAMGL